MVTIVLVCVRVCVVVIDIHITSRKLPEPDVGNKTNTKDLHI